VEQRVAIVTGAARGIGAVIARRLEDDGYVVYALDRTYASEAKGPRKIRADLTNHGEVHAGIQRILRQEGRIDVLVNNAGMNLTGPLEHADLDAVEQCLSVYVTALLRVCQAVIPVMKEARHGRIINAASFAAIVPAIGGGVYAASKSAVVQLTRALAGELGPWDITVNAYAPGMVPTEMNGFADMSDDDQKRLLDTLTLRRWGRPDDVADLVSYLAGENSGYITGSLMDVSGGKLATQTPYRAYELQFCSGAGCTSINA